MEHSLQLTDRIEAVQRKLREANYECNRLRELIETALPKLETTKAAEGFTPSTNLAPATPQSQTQQPPAKPQSKQTTQAPAPKSLAQSAAIRLSLEAAAPATAPLAYLPSKRRSQANTQPPSNKTATPPPPKAPVKKRDMEDFIGANLLNKIGIGILILGIGIFVKYAIDQDWIGPIGRVLIGLLSGGILIGVAHKLRTQYKAFSSVLLGGGIVVLYFSIAISFHQYALISQTAAFGMMCAVTAAAVVFSIGYNRQEIAILAVLGGFATPFLVATGSGNYVALFSYLLILNIGMMVLSAFREWQAVRVLSFSLSILLYAGWMALNFLDSATPVLGGALAFALAFFVVFFVMNMVFYVRARKALGGLEYVLLLVNSLFFYCMGMLVLYQMSTGIYMGLFTALMGAFHFLAIYPVRKLIKVDSKVFYLLIGMVLSFITLAIPIQLRGDYLALLWSVEAALVLFLAQHSGIKLLRTGSVVVSMLAILALLVEWTQAYLFPQTTLTFLANGTFVTTFVAIAAFAVQYLLYRRDAGEKTNAMGMSLFAGLMVLVIGFVGVSLELWGHYSLISAAHGMLAVLCFGFLYIAGMQLWALRSGMVMFGWMVSVCFALMMMGFAAFNLVALHTPRLNGDSILGTQFVMLPGLLLAGFLSFWLLRKQVTLKSAGGSALIWVTAVIAIFVSSMELDNLMAMINVDLSQVHRTGYPILWGIMGAGMIVWGLKIKVVSLRVIGLALFSLILVKLFAFDIWTASATGKIAAFISLGVLMLVVSFLYQKIKLLLKDDSQPNA